MTLLEHIEIARSIMREHSRFQYLERNVDAQTGMEYKRSLAHVIIALHPELAHNSGSLDDMDERIDMLVEVINEQMSDAEYMQALWVESHGH